METYLFSGDDKLRTTQQIENALGQFYIRKNFKGYPYLVSAIQEALDIIPGTLSMEKLCERIAPLVNTAPDVVSRELTRMVNSIWNHSLNQVAYSKILGSEVLTRPLPIEFIYNLAGWIKACKKSKRMERHMLQFIDGRFHAYGISFTMPNGFHLHDEQHYPFGLCCFSPDYKIYMTVKVAPEGGNIRAGLQAILRESSRLHPISVVQSIIINGTRGYDVLYNSNGIEYYEARLRFAGGQIVTCLAQCEAKQHMNLKNNASVQALLQTIHEETVS